MILPIGVKKNVPLDLSSQFAAISDSILKQKKFNRWELSGQRYKNYETFTFLPRFCRNRRYPDGLLSKQIATIRLHHWFVYTALGRPKSAQTRAARAKVISRNIKKLLMHRVNEAMSLSLALHISLFRLKKYFGQTQNVKFVLLRKKNGGLIFFHAKDPKYKVRPTLNFVVFPG